MGLENLVQWTRRKFSQFTGEEVPVTRPNTLDTLTKGTVAVPLLDLFENQNELRLVIDAPGATTHNTHVTWNDVDTLAVYVQRAASPPDSLWLSEYEEADWYREIVVLSPDVEGTKAASTVRDGVVTIRLPKRRTSSHKVIPVHAG